MAELLVTLPTQNLGTAILCPGCAILLFSAQWTGLPFLHILTKVLWGRGGHGATLSSAPASLL